MSVPRTTELPPGVIRTTIPTAGGPIAALSMDPPTRTDLPAVLLVPGFTGSKEDFTPQLPLLAAAGYRAVAIDQRGQLDSVGPDDPKAFQRDALASDVAEIVSAMNHPHLVGHSYGGIVSRAAILDHDARPASFVLVGSGPAAIQGNRRMLMEAMIPILDEGGIAGVWAAVDALERSQPNYDETPVAVRDFLRHRFLSSSPHALREMGTDLISEPDRVSELAMTGLPMFVCHGEDDDAWPPAVQREMATALGAAYSIIPDALHSPAVESPEAFALALLGFWRARRD